MRAENQDRKDTSPSLQGNRCKRGRPEPGFVQQHRDLTPAVDRGLTNLISTHSLWERKQGWYIDLTL